jgi:hypothetical protein
MSISLERTQGENYMQFLNVKIPDDSSTITIADNENVGIKILDNKKRMLQLAIPDQYRGKREKGKNQEVVTLLLTNPSRKIVIRFEKQSKPKEDPHSKPVHKLGERFIRPEKPTDV